MASSVTTVSQTAVVFGDPILPRSTRSIPAPPDEGDDNVSRPDIEWIPSRDTYLERVERLAKSRSELPSAVPDGWPEKVDAPRVWTGSDFSDPAQYVVEFNQDDIAEIESALAHLKGMTTHAPLR
jgi:hypothetical protein